MHASTNALPASANPYAAALREPGRSKRAWDAGFLHALGQPSSGDLVQFELTAGRLASGTVRITQFQDGELSFLSGDLTAPEPGKFFFLKPPLDGKAGKAVGVIEFPLSRKAYRIEPTGPGGEPELWERRLDEVVCVGMPRAESAALSTNTTAEMPPLRPDYGAGYVPSYNSNIVSLQSYPGSPAVLLLDFFGGYTPTWGGITYSRPANVNNTTIRDLWKRVAEDYMPFNINVTTDIKVYLAAPANSRQRCCFTDTPVTAAGVAYIGSWNWGNDTPCWSVYTTGKNGAEVGAHEPGHTLGLGHMGSQSSTSTNEYYSGQGSGATGWAPIMGVGYYQPVSTWAKGEYQYANNTQDELAVIDTQNNNVSYRPDDTGSTLATSRFLELYPDSSAAAEGVVETPGDTDAFQFTTTGGQVALTASPVGDWADLALSVSLSDDADVLWASSNPQNTLSASVNVTVPAGTYVLRITGAGRNDSFINGFSSYGSLGYYSVAGWVSGGRLPTRLSIVEHAPVGTVVGAIPAGAATNLLAYAITSGNTGGTFAVDSNGVLTVANTSWLDYIRLGTNTMFPVQFQLSVNITNLDDANFTELNRRVVVSVLNSTNSYPLSVRGYNAGLIVPNNATTAFPKATAFDIQNNFALYAAGLSANAQAGGTGGGQGLPASGTVLSQVDGATFQLGPYGATNALLLGYTFPASGTLTLTTPQSLNSLSLLASSASGGGNGFLYITFTNGSRSATVNFNAQDWYNVTTNVAAQGFGRLKLGQTTLYTENPGWNNPNLYQTTINLAAMGLNQPVASVTFGKPAAGTTTTTAIFGLSGTPMPAQVAIVAQPQSVTNTVPAAGATFSVTAMGAPPLGYQWYYSSSGVPSTFAPLSGQAGASLFLSPVLDVTNAGSFYVVVTNSLSAATSSVAKLTVYRAPFITAQPAPGSLFLFSGATNTFSAAANGASPLYYYWMTNGTPIPGANSLSLTLRNLQVSNSGLYSVMVSNSFGAVTSSVVSLTVLTSPTYPYAQAVLRDRPIGYWRLDETSGAVAHDYIAGVNGTYNRVQLAQPGYRLVDTHTAAKFGVLAANNSYVTNLPLDFSTSSNAAFSIEAWVFGGPQTNDAGVITKGYGSGGEQFNLDCGAYNHAYRFFVRDASGTAHLANSAVVPTNRWHHLVGVCDQANAAVYLYVDSTNVTQASITAGSGLLASTNSVSFGSRQSGPSTLSDLQFLGSMEEVAIYNYALSSNQVWAHFSTATNRPPVFLVDPVVLASINAGQLCSGTLAPSAVDPNGDSLIFSKLSGPAWLTVTATGGVNGTPLSADAGTNTFTVRATDAYGAFNTAQMLVTVNAAPPMVVVCSVQDTNLLLNWSGGVGPYQVQMSTNLAQPYWETISAGLGTPTLLVAPTNAAAFYRILGQ